MAGGSWEASAGARLHQWLVIIIFSKHRVRLWERRPTMGFDSLQPLVSSLLIAYDKDIMHPMNKYLFICYVFHGPDDHHLTNRFHREPGKLPPKHNLGNALTCCALFQRHLRHGEDPVIIPYDRTPLGQREFRAAAVFARPIRLIRK